MKSRITAALLAIFLGGLGVHRFYLGQGGLGILHLLFCWTFVPAFIGVIDGILLLLMSDQNFDRKYNFHFFAAGQNNSNQHTIVINNHNNPAPNGNTNNHANPGDSGTSTNAETGNNSDYMV